MQGLAFAPLLPYRVESPLTDSELGDAAVEFKLPDLMYYEDRVVNIWEWPVQRHRQKLIVYTMIPPSAWIMAALVERMLDTVLS